MFTKSFLEDSGLYQKCEVPIDKAIGVDFNNYHGPALARICAPCKHPTTWNQPDGFRLIWSGNPHFRSLYDSFSTYVSRANSPGAEQPLSPAPEGECIFSMTYRCEACKKSQVVYIIRSVMALRSMKWPVDLCFYVEKVGQWPPPWREVPTELRKWLGDHDMLFKKGIACEGESFGLGAFAYYRRIVEDLIDTLLEDVADLFENDAEQQTYLATLKDIDAATIHADKIDIVKGLVPSALTRDEGNPLGFLHSALSAGLHSLSEEECLEFAGGLRRTMEHIYRQIRLARENDKTYSHDIRELKKKLDRKMNRRGMVQ